MGCIGNVKETSQHATSSKEVCLVDSSASQETKKLYYNLYQLQGKAILFGQQNALASGVGWKNDSWRCDVYDICGSYPAIFGWELSEMDKNKTIDSLSYEKLTNWMSSIYDLGGVNVVNWQFNTDLIYSSYKYTIGDLFNVGPINTEFKRQLSNMAGYLNKLNSKEGIKIPVFLRLFPDGKTFKSGLSFELRDSADFINLWRYSVSFLRDSCQVHNALYVYSTKQFLSKTDFMSFFPGASWVDVIGLNNYADFSFPETVSRGVHQLSNLSEYASSIHKLSALTETGQEGLSDKNWWTSLFNPIKADENAKNISWIMTWKNTSKSSFFTPYPNSLSVQDFVKFESDSVSYFIDDLGTIYH